MAFQPVSFQIFAKATIGQNSSGTEKKLMGELIMCAFTSNSLIIPFADKASCKIPVTMIHERKCGRYEIV